MTMESFDFGVASAVTDVASFDNKGTETKPTKFECNVSKIILKTKPFIHKKANVTIFSKRKLITKCEDLREERASEERHLRKYRINPCNESRFLCFSSYFLPI